MKNIFEKILLIFVALTCINMGTGERVSTTLDPVYTKLEDGAGSFKGTIFNKVDGKLIQTNVIDISFSGKTSIGGIKSENDDSYTTLDFAKITKLIIEDPEYESKRYGRKDFILASLVDNEGKKHSDFLIPKNVIVCGLTEEGRLEKAWFLRYMQKIEILRKPVMQKTKDEVVEEKSILTRISEYVGG
ncbi:MAG: hypothetical protein ABIA74_00990 [bacterium]